MTKISDMTPLTSLPASGASVPIVKTGDTTPYEYDLAAGLASLRVTPQQYGAAADGVTDDYVAFKSAIAALSALSLNPSSGSYYHGSPRLFVPAGNYYLNPLAHGDTGLDVLHTLMIEGEGSGQFGPGGGGCTHLRFPAGCNGIRFQAADTSGNTTIDSPIHPGSGGASIRDICIEGGFNGTTEGDYHGLVIRNAIKAERLYIKNWPGEGVKAWAGNVTGQPSVSGNVSTTMLVSVKTEGCRGGIDIRGSDSNVVTTINCEGYQNRWFGLLDDNGAGSNTHIGMHCASNGVVFGTWPQTQCSYSSKYYALKWGGDPTVAPSGTTADTANWLYIGAGAPFANLIPAWVNTPNTFRAGGEYLTLNSAGVLILNCYSETGGFSQFNNNTFIQDGTLTAQYFRGGVQLSPSGLGDGMTVKVGGDNHHYLDFSGTQAGLQARDLVTASVLAYLVFRRADSWWLTGGLNLHTGALRVAETQVVGARQTGWTASTGTPARGSFSAAAAGTASGAYVQAELQGALNRIAALEARLIALEADARTHGLIN